MFGGQLVEDHRADSEFNESFDPLGSFFVVLEM